MLTIKNRAGKILIFFLAAVTLFAGCAPPGARALLRGKKLVERGKYAEAVETLRTATVLLGGTNAQAFNYLGLACHQAGQTTEATRSYQKALALNPDLAEAHYNLGCLWLDQGKWEPAKGEFTAYTLHRPNSADGWLKLGLAQFRQSQAATASLRGAPLAAAEKSFNEGLRLSPNNPEALTGLGLVRVQRGRAPEAAQFFKRALEAQPAYAAALLNLAIVEQQYLGHPQLALEKYRQYLALKPAPANADAVTAVVLQLEQEQAPAPRPAGATPTQPTAAPTRPSPAGAPAQARSRSSAPEPVSVETPRTPGLSKFSGTEVARTSGAARAEPPTNLPSPEPASTVPRPASSPTPAPATLPPAALSPSAETRTPRYRYQSPPAPKAGNRSEAERAFAQGVQAHQAQRLSEALGSYRTALRLDPSFYDASYNLGLAATQAGDLPLALSSYENALAIRPLSSDARYNFALVLKQANYPLDAANELEKLLAARPDDTRAHLALGNLYAQQLRDPAKARLHYIKVLESDPLNPQAAAIRSWLADASH